MRRAPYWAPKPYRRGAIGNTLGVWWSLAVPRLGSGLPIIVEVDRHRVTVEFPWWARTPLLASLWVRRLIRSGVLR